MGLHSTLFGPVKYAIPAAAAERARADRRQRHGRDGHLRRDPARHDRRRPARRGARGRPAATSRCACIGVAVARAARRRRRVPPSPATRPDLSHQLEPVHRDLAQPQARARQPASSCARCSASRGCGSSAPSFLAQFPAFAQGRCCTATSRSHRSCSWCSRSASASARCCARCCRGRQRRDRPRAVRRDRHDACSRSTCGFATRGLPPSAGCTAWRRSSPSGAHWRVMADLVLLVALRRASTACRCTR